ncbi:MAG: hypothetical protein OHK0046_48780 [Anaerolineae bacterium]
MAGCTYYQRRKQLVMAARLPEEAAPLQIHYTLETVTAEAGDVIVFEPGEQVHRRLKDYNFWSVKLPQFKESYRPWDEPLALNPTLRDLMRHRCKPYYKHQGVWARKLTKDTYIQSLESDDPQLVPAGLWLAIGSSGEPWHIEDETFRERYIIPADDEART